MKRLLLIVALATGALVGGSAAPASAAGGYWACAGTYIIDFGVCVKNPMPEQLPVPDPGVNTDFVEPYVVRVESWGTCVVANTEDWALNGACPF